LLKTLFFCGLLAGVSAGSSAAVYYSKQEAMELAFGPGATIEAMPLFLSEAEQAAIERLAHVALDSKLYTLYVGKREGQVLGYAAIETHTVRTKPETLLIVLDAEGHLRQVVVLAFHEPPEYQPPADWLARLIKVPLEEMRLGGGVDGISGATLSARATVDSVRKVLAIYRVAVAGGK
jgi:Na+-translocating ferredoxin:NAD+ oxidoreductase RnfG subunit